MLLMAFRLNAIEKKLDAKRTQPFKFSYQQKKTAMALEERGTRARINICSQRHFATPRPTWPNELSIFQQSAHWLCGCSA
jgi:hypothetical protein